MILLKNIRSRTRCSAVFTPMITVLLMIFASLLQMAQGYDEVLFDMSKVKTELRWEQIARNHDPEEAAWSEETWRNPNAIDEIHANQRAYVTCNYDMENPDNWLFMNAIGVRQARRLFFEILFNTRDCDGYADPKSCKETFSVYLKEFKTRTEAVSNVTSPRFGGDRDKSWTSIARLARSNQNVTKETISMRIGEDTKFVRLAFNEQGICLSLLNIKIYYRVCDEFTDSLVHFDRQVSGAGENEIINIQGECIRNASKTIQEVPLVGICMSSGNAIKTSGQCECDAGFLQIADSNGVRCESCPANTFRPRGKDATQCLPCPSNSISNEASSQCRCFNGYARADDDSTTSGCTQPPSRPIKLTASAVSASSVRLSWDEPSNLGGRPELWYDVKCSGRGVDCGGVVMTPSDRMLATRYVQINGLRPQQDYTFMVYARNKVSAMDGMDVMEKHAIIDVRTRSKEDDRLPVSHLRVDAAQSDGLTIAWSTEDGDAKDFEVEVRPAIQKKRGFETRHVNATYTTFIGLKSDVIYTFRVRLRDDLRWSESISYQNGRGIVSQTTNGGADDGSEQALLNQAGSALLMVIAGILVVIAVALCMIVMQKKSKNRKQMSDLDVLDTYKQDSMTPDYHTAARHHHHMHHHHQTSSSSTMPSSNLHDQLRSATKLNAPLIPSFGSPISQPPPYYGGMQTQNSGKYRTYVDPTTYEDPYQALVEFTFDIDPHDVFITQVIGGGEFGDVCLGGLARTSQAATKWQSANTINRMFENEQFETVAIKTLKAGSSPKAKAEFLTEATIMGQFSHPNVIRLIGVVTSAEPVMIVAEYMANGSLDQFLRQTDGRGEKLAWEKISEMLYGIASGMKYLADMGYVHRDLAARNVLVDTELRCKIADFGLSRGIRQETSGAEGEYTTNGGKIPVRWTAPEAITHRKFTPSSDVWSFGVVIWEACSYGERPYWDWTNQKVISEVMIGYRLPPPLDCPMGLYRVAQWCWKMERHERPTFTQLLAMFHKYILQPHLIQMDPGELPRRAVSAVNLNTYGAIAVPTPPTSAPPMPTLEEFLRSIGLNHVYGQLVSNHIETVSELAQTSHLDLLACGLISQECSTIRDGLNNRVTPPPQQQAPTIQHHQTRGTRTLNPKSARNNDEGFFV